MHQTLFFIPHWIFEGPLLISWLVLGGIVLAFFYMRHGNSNETWSFLPVYGIVSLVIFFVMPRLETTGINPDDPTGEWIMQGLAIRGYGLFLLTALVIGVGVILARCPAIGLTHDQVLGLTFWMMVSGIFGARLFFVVQNSDAFLKNGFSLQVLIEIVDMTKGGLVVYGSLIGGSLGAIVYMRWNQMPLWKTADILAPAMPLGLAIGRIGCLMNGCCFGGVCDLPLPSVTFPAGSPPYMQQLIDGDLVGINATSANDKEKRDPDFPIRVESIVPKSLADQLGILPGDNLAISRTNLPGEMLIRFEKNRTQKPSADERELVGFIESQRQGRLAFPISDLPDRSLQTHPTQIYSAINAGLLFLVLWFYWTIRKKDGEVFGLMLTLYPIGRFLMESIRTDELGQFGTSLTISQWVSILMFAMGIGIIVWTRLRKPIADHETPLSPGHT